MELTVVASPALRWPCPYLRHGHRPACRSADLPGAGKGTQAAFIANQLDVPKISTGDIFRANISHGAPLGVKVKEYLDTGQLVPEELTMDIVRDRLFWQDAIGGFVLDGFPRSVAQAEELAGSSPTVA